MTISRSEKKHWNMKTLKHKNKNKFGSFGCNLGHSDCMSGLSLVEAILGVALFAILIAGLAGSFVYGSGATSIAGKRARAVLVAEEGLEAVRNVRDENFTNLSDGTYGLAVVGNEWILSGSSDITDVFTRQITISSVDLNTKQLNSTVTWQQTADRAGSVSLITYLTNWLRTASGIGDWYNPVEEASLDISGNQNGLKIQVSGDYAYLVRNGGSPDFVVIDISNSASPSITASLNLAGNPMNIALSGNYAYVVSTDNNKELQIIDISTPSSPNVVGTFNAGEKEDALGVYTVGSTVYLVRKSSKKDEEFYVIDVSTPSSPVSLGSLELSKDGNEIIVMGNYAYIASDHNSQELQVVDISIPGSMSISGSLNLSGNSNSETITGFDDTIVLGRSDGYVYVIDVSIPTSPSFIGSYDVGDVVRDISLGNENNYIFIACDQNAAEFQVIDISTPATPAFISSMDLTADDLNGVAYHADQDRAYTVGERNDSEFRAFMPQ